MVGKSSQSKISTVWHCNWVQSCRCNIVWRRTSHNGSGVLQSGSDREKSTLSVIRLSLTFENLVNCQWSKALEDEGYFLNAKFLHKILKAVITHQIGKGCPLSCLRYRLQKVSWTVEKDGLRPMPNKRGRGLRNNIFGPSSPKIFYKLILSHGLKKWLCVGFVVVTGNPIEPIRGNVPADDQ